MYTVYALSSLKKEYIYVGFTSDLEKRINRHNKGYEKTTNTYRPFKLIFKEEYPTRDLARKKEKYLKSGEGKIFLKNLK